ncbi:putative nucleotidyltransferase, ribonuclease H, partial [Tanacetum coccineum]
MDSVNMFDPMTLSDAYQRALAFEKQNHRVGSSSSPTTTSASGSGNVASRFAPSQAKAGGGNTGPVSRASGSSGLKCFNCGEPGHRQSECKKAGKRHLFADPEGDDDAAYEEYEESPVMMNNPSCDNLIAAEAVQKLGLKTENHPKPYKLQWLKKGGEVTFLGKEVDEDSVIPEAMIPLLEEFSEVFPDEPHYRMSPREHEELRRMVHGISGAIIFTKLDLKSGYYQIRLRLGDEWKTAFKTSEGLYEWPFIGKFVVVYFDDILIYSASFNELVTHVRQVLSLKRFIPIFSSITGPFDDCVKGKYLIWTKGIAELAFQVFKEKAYTSPILILPDFYKVLSFITDASKVAIGGVIRQGGRTVAILVEVVKTMYRSLFCHDHVSLKGISLLMIRLALRDRYFLQLVGKLSLISGNTPHLLRVRGKSFCHKRCSIAVFARSERARLLMQRYLDASLCQADKIHAHNHAVNRSTGFSPFEGYMMFTKLFMKIWFMPIPSTNKMRITSGYKLILKRVTLYGLFLKGCFPVGEYNKLSAMKVGPLEIVEKINSNAYRLKLPSHIRCSNVFNVKYLIPYHGDSFDDDLAMNSRTNFVYPGGMMEAQNQQIQFVILLFSLHQLVSESKFLIQMPPRKNRTLNESKNPFGEDDDSYSDDQSGRRPRRNQREDNRRVGCWNESNILILLRSISFWKQNHQVGSSSSLAITGASGSGNVASRFAPSQAKAGGGYTGPVSRASGSSGLKCFNYGKPGHRQSECTKAGKRHLFADLEGDDDAAYEEYKEASVYDEEPECEEEYVYGDVGVNLEVVVIICISRSSPKPWEYDRDITYNGRTNTYSFLFGGVKITLMPNKPKEVISKPTGTLLTLSQFEDELDMGDDVFVLIGKEVAEGSEISEAMIPLLEEFLDVFPDELPDRFPSLCDIQHHIDLEPGSQLPNMSHYKMSSGEHEELHRQVEELVSKGHISGATIFTKLDLKSGYYQIRLRPGDEWKTAFKTRGWPFIGKFVVVYFDDILIYIASFNEHVIHVDESKVAAVQEWPTPTTITDVRYCMKGKSFIWTKEAEFAFQVVKEKLTSTPILILPDFSKVFELHTDASKVAIGGVLSQVVQAVKHWRHYLFQKEFVLFIDHDSLRYIRTQDKVSHKHRGWLAFLEKFTFMVKPKTGVSNRVADALNRMSGFPVTMQVDVPGLDIIRDMVIVDPYFSIVLHGVQAREKLDFFLHDGFLFKGNQLCIHNSSLRLQIIKELHGEGHVGHDRTLQLVQASYF